MGEPAEKTSVEPKNTMNQSIQRKNLFRGLIVLLPLFALLWATLAPAAADARPSRCFGKKINRVIAGNNKTVRLKYKDVVWIAGDKVTVIGKPYSVICADKGRQIVRAGKGLSRTSTGRDADRIYLHKSSNMNIVQAGLGNDTIVGSRGHDFLYGSPKRVSKNAADTDVINGMGGNDRIYDYGGSVNRLYGMLGSDRIYSLGTAVSQVHGGNGSDFIYSNGGKTKSGRVEMLFGERGNDRLLADRKPANGPAFLDGGSGDDWAYGTNYADTFLFQSGITKIRGFGGDDLIIGSTTAAAKIVGGSGRDKISFASHTPPGYRGRSGVMINLAQGFAQGSLGKTTLSGVEEVTGSSFDDEIIGRSGQTEVLDGGLGDDLITGQYKDEDQADGGLGQNECVGFRAQKNCGESSPGSNDFRRTLVDIDAAGVLTLVGSNNADRMDIGFERGQSRYVVNLDADGVPSGSCYTPNQGPGRTVYCPVDQNRMNGMLVYGNQGGDRITVGYSVPMTVTATINAGSGLNTVLGGKGRDQISSESGSAGSILDGRAGSDEIRFSDGIIARGGPGNDVIQDPNVCWGGSADGGPGTDNLVFAGSDRGVEADLSKGFARFIGGCAKQLTFTKTFESLEGSPENDRLTLGPRMRSQQGVSSMLGRGGIDYLNSRNGSKDSVMTGDGGHKNTVISDRKDRVIWGWGLGGY